MYWPPDNIIIYSVQVRTPSSETELGQDIRMLSGQEHIRTISQETSHYQNLYATLCYDTRLSGHITLRDNLLGHFIRETSLLGHLARGKVQHEKNYKDVVKNP